MQLISVFYAQRGGEAARRLPAQNAGRGFRIAGLANLPLRPCVESRASRLLRHEGQEPRRPASSICTVAKRTRRTGLAQSLPGSVSVRARRNSGKGLPGPAQGTPWCASKLARRSPERFWVMQLRRLPELSLAVKRWLLEGGAARTGAAAQAALHFTESWGVEQRDAADEARASPAVGAVLAADPGVRRSLKQAAGPARVGPSRNK